MNIKLSIITALTVSLLLMLQSAHADFRKALDAYIARDGDTMLKEVKDAVEKKNDDGLMLLLMATNMDAATSDYDETTKQSKSTLRAILPQPKWDEVRELLVQATNNSSVNEQYYLIVKSQFSRDFMVQRLQAEQIKHGEQPQKEFTTQEMNQAYIDVNKSFLDKGLLPFADNSSVSSITELAQAGDPEYQTILGFSNLGFSNDYGYQCENKSPAFAALCEVKIDNAKGYDWLKKAVKGYEQDGLLSEGYGKFSSNMCKFLLELKNPTSKDLRQAYLWGFLAANLGDPFAEDLLRKMHRSGKLRTVAPKLDAVWDTQKRNQVLYVKNIKEWPDMVLKARKGLTQKNTPILSYLYFGRPDTYALEVYSDGRVFIKDMQSTGYKTLFTKVSVKHVRLFLKELYQTGIGNWPLFPERIDCGSCRTSSTYMRVSLYDKDLIRRLTLPTVLERVDFDENVRKNTYRIAKLKLLVDNYFPTKQMRIELGNNGKEQQRRLAEENKWVELAKKENRNGF